jgi:multidrug efflux pump subunit AcrA (membrane-fusion protein)
MMAWDRWDQARMSIRVRTGGLWGLALAAAMAAGPGCGPKAEPKAQASEVPRTVITVGAVEERPVVRTVEMVGTLKGWEEVTVGAKTGGRVLQIDHDMGDRVAPGEPLARIDPIDAQLAVQQAEARYLAELVKLGITREQSEAFFEKYGVNEQIMRGAEADKIIQQVPGIVQMRVQLEKAKNDANRQRNLFNRGSGTVQEVQDYDNLRDAAAAALDSAVLTARTTIAVALSNRVALDQARQALEDATIRVPPVKNLPPNRSPDHKVSLAVTRRSVSEGQMVKPGDPVADLVLEDPLRLWGNVPERYTAEVKVGQPVNVRVAAFDRDFPGQVARINPSVDPISRTFQVEVSVPNPEGHMRPGGFAKAAVVTRRDDQAIVVPREAVEKFAGVTKVFTVAPDGQTVKSVTVEVGLEEAGWFEVKGDLKAGQKVAISNLAQLADGTRVTVREPEPETDAEKAKAAAQTAVTDEVVTKNEAAPGPPTPAKAEAPAPSP